MSHAQEHAYNPADPHGFHEGEEHHGHVIVPWQILLGVLIILLGFTALTVFQAQFEKFASSTWGWDLPGWVNVVLAMGIACVKGTLVVLFFMQLRYDKGINILLFLFTIFAVWLFIMFTAIDLMGRGTITEWRSGEVIAGGSGYGVRREGVVGPMYVAVKDQYITNHGIEEYEHELHAHHAGHEQVEVSDAWTSRSRSGLTEGLFSTGVWEHVGNAHDEHAQTDEHSEVQSTDEPAQEMHDEDADGH